MKTIISYVTWCHVKCHNTWTCLKSRSFSSWSQSSPVCIALFTVLVKFLSFQTIFVRFCSTFLFDKLYGLMSISLLCTSEWNPIAIVIIEATLFHEVCRNRGPSASELHSSLWNFPSIHMLHVEEGPGSLWMHYHGKMAAFKNKQLILYSRTAQQTVC